MTQPKLFFIGVKALIENSEGELLLLLADVTTHSKNTEPYWDIPGGRIEAGDSLVGTLQREIEEETGITELNIAPQQLTTVLSNHETPLDNGKTAGLVLVVYRVAIETDVKIILSDEHERYEWVNKSEAAKRLRNKYPASFTEIIESY